MNRPLRPLFTEQLPLVVVTNSASVALHRVRPADGESVVVEPFDVAVDTAHVCLFDTRSAVDIDRRSYSLSEFPEHARGYVAMVLHLDAFARGLLRAFFWHVPLSRPLF